MNTAVLINLYDPLAYLESMIDELIPIHINHLNYTAEQVFDVLLNCLLVNESEVEVDPGAAIYYLLEIGFIHEDALEIFDKLRRMIESIILTSIGTPKPYHRYFVMHISSFTYTIEDQGDYRILEYNRRQEEQRLYEKYNPSEEQQWKELEEENGFY